MATIEHTDKRRITEVDRCAGGWFKKENYVFLQYLEEDGWREVKEEKLVNATNDYHINCDGEIEATGVVPGLLKGDRLAIVLAVKAWKESQQ